MIEKKEYQTPKINEIELDIKQVVFATCKTNTFGTETTCSCWQEFSAQVCQTIGS